VEKYLARCCHHIGTGKGHSRTERLVNANTVPNVQLLIRLDRCAQYRAQLTEDIKGGANEKEYFCIRVNGYRFGLAIQLCLFTHLAG
jgi:hypothetical protein